MILVALHLTQVFFISKSYFYFKKDKIRYYNDKDEVIHAITNQIKTIISDNNIKNSEIIGLGIASPGPLDSKKGIILNTPNLKIFRITK